MEVEFFATAAMGEGGVRRGGEIFSTAAVWWGLGVGVGVEVEF